LSKTQKGCADRTCWKGDWGSSKHLTPQTDSPFFAMMEVRNEQNNSTGSEKKKNRDVKDTWGGKKPRTNLKITQTYGREPNEKLKKEGGQLDVPLPSKIEARTHEKNNLCTIRIRTPRGRNKTMHDSKNTGKKKQTLGNQSQALKKIILQAKSWQLPIKPKGNTRTGRTANAGVTRYTRTGQPAEKRGAEKGRGIFNQKGVGEKKVKVYNKPWGGGGAGTIKNMCQGRREVGHMAGTKQGHGRKPIPRAREKEMEERVEGG